MLSRLPPLFSRSRVLRFAYLVVNGLTQALAMAGIGLVLKAQFNAIATVDTSSNLSLFGPAAAIALTAIAIGVLKWRERVDAEALGQDYVHETRMRVFKHVNELSVRAVAEMRKGLILLRFVNDLTALRQWISLGIARTMVSATVLLGSCVALILINPMIGGVLLLVAASGVAGSMALGRCLDETIREARRRRGHIAGNLSEKLEQVTLVQAFAQRRPERRRVKKQSARLRSAMIQRASAIGWLRALVQCVTGLALAGAAAAGALSIREGLATPGEIVAAIGIIALAAPSLSDFGRVYEYWKSAAVAREKMVALLSRGPVIAASRSSKPLGPVKGDLTFDHVTVTPVLQRYFASAKSGDVVGICGPNGSGKTTLLSLALRLLDPDSGRVTLDGRDLRDIRSGELRRAISIASSSMPLLRGTVESNIVYGSAKASGPDVDKAAQACGIDISSPDSPFHRTRIVHEGGANLSAGERMRIVMARALVCNPRVLLLDEPEKHLDAGSVDILQELIIGFQGTVLLATHDQRLLRLTDTIWQLKENTANEDNRDSVEGRGYAA